MADTDNNDDTESPSRPELLFSALQALPLMEDLFLQMQSRNLAIVDDHIIAMEREVLRIHIDRERTPVPEIATLSAFSQLWIFGLYELLRTWRQRSRELLAFKQRYEAANPQDRPRLLEEEARSGDSPSGIQGPVQLALRQRLESVVTGGLAAAIEDALDKVAEPYRRLESLRVTLAKHEIPKTKGIPSMAPGYVRQDMAEGCLTWFVELRDGTQDIVSRCSVADDLIAAVLPA